MTKELITIAVSSVLATIGSVVAVLLVDYIKHKFIKPKQDFNKLRSKIYSVLVMYANRLSNPIKYEAVTPENEGYYKSAELALREIAVELDVFVNQSDIKTIDGITNEQLRKAVGDLFLLSNSVFVATYESEFTNPKTNRNVIKEVKDILKIK